MLLHRNECVCFSLREINISHCIASNALALYQHNRNEFTGIPSIRFTARLFSTETLLKTGIIPRDSITGTFPA